MAKARSVPSDHAPLAGLPVRSVTVGSAGEQVAVHVGGQLGPDRIPVVCVAGYNRNMADYRDFLRVGAPLTLAIAFTTAWLARWLWLGGPLLPGIGG